MANKYKRTNVKLVDLKEFEGFEKGQEYIFIKSKAVKSVDGEKLTYFDRLSGRTFIHNLDIRSRSKIEPLYKGGVVGIALTVFPEDCKKVIRENGGRK